MNNPEQEREEIKDGLREVVASYASLLSSAMLDLSLGLSIKLETLDGLAVLLARERSFMERRAIVDGAEPPPPVVPVTTIPTKTIAARLLDEGVWQVYVDFMWSAPARRSAFAKAMFLDGAIESTDVPTRNSMLNAGLTQEQVDRVMALDS